MFSTLIELLVKYKVIPAHCFPCNSKSIPHSTPVCIEKLSEILVSGEYLSLAVKVSTFYQSEVTKSNRRYYLVCEQHPNTVEHITDDRYCFNLALSLLTVETG